MVHLLATLLGRRALVLEVIPGRVINSVAIKGARECNILQFPLQKGNENTLSFAIQRKLDQFKNFLKGEFKGYSAWLIKLARIVQSLCLFKSCPY